METDFARIIQNKVESGEWSHVWSRIQSRVASRLIRFLNKGLIAGITIDKHGFRTLSHSSKPLV